MSEWVSGSLLVAHSREATKKENENQMLNTQTKMMPNNLQNDVKVLKWRQKVTQDLAKKNTSDVENCLKNARQCFKQFTLQSPVRKYKTQSAKCTNQSNKNKTQRTKCNYKIKGKIMIQAVCNLHSRAQSLFRPVGLCKSRQLFSNQNVFKISHQKALKAKFVAHWKMNGLPIFVSFISIKAGTYP